MVVDINQLFDKRCDACAEMHYIPTYVLIVPTLNYNNRKTKIQLSHKLYTETVVNRLYENKTLLKTTSTP